MAVHHFGEEGKDNLELWKFGKQLPEWTVGVEGLPSIGRISPSGTRLVTFPGYDQTGGYVCIWDVDNGRLLAELSHPWSTRPLDITFDSEDRFYSHHDAYRVLYVVCPLPRRGGPSYSIAHRGQLPLVSQALRRQYYVDDSHEWVVSGTHRICWIPPGFIGPVAASHCWVGSSLVMAGQDGTLRKLTFGG